MHGPMNLKFIRTHIHSVYWISRSPHAGQSLSCPLACLEGNAVYVQRKGLHKINYNKSRCHCGRNDNLRNYEMRHMAWLGNNCIKKYPFAIRVPKLVTVKRIADSNNVLTRHEGGGGFIFRLKVRAHTWVVWNVLGLDHRWQQYRQHFFPKFVHLS
jgi:hypothetical protein